MKKPIKLGVREISTDTTPTTEKAVFTTKVFEFGYDKSQVLVEVKPQQGQRRAGMFIDGLRMTNDDISEIMIQIEKGENRQLNINGVNGNTAQLIGAMETLLFYLEAQEKVGKLE